MITLGGGKQGAWYPVRSAGGRGCMFLKLVVTSTGGIAEFVEDIMGLDFLATGRCNVEELISASFIAKSKISSCFLFL